MIVRVVMSRETRMPVLSFSLGTAARHPTTYLGPELALTMTARLSCRVQGKEELTSLLVELS